MNAIFKGNPAEAFIFKASQAVEPTYQQSYPQKLGMTLKVFSNQQLKRCFASSHQLTMTTRGFM
ncbi:hypothetical protein [Polaromonas sp. C04]|uniref:hypothetical protein n=1 Tax=Polaromonas sp. C04 TaxID=1945857 RepID=UPI001184ABC0|nr:hypothetical protein [Polaromonas sp. C04]